MANERNLILSQRETDRRDKRKVTIIEFDLDDIYQHFKDNLSEIIKKFEIADKLEVAGEKEACKDIWRTQIVFLDSALDFYIHEITKYGMKKIYNGIWDKTPKYENFTIKLKDAERLVKENENEQLFFNVINDLIEDKTYMDSNHVKEQCSLIGINFNQIADEAFHIIGGTEKPISKIKKTLDKLFYRRNTIAHQSDRYHENGAKLEIDKDIVSRFIIDIEKIVSAIHKSIELKNSIE